MKHYAISTMLYLTEQSYCQWALRYIRYCGGSTHLADLNASDIERFLSHLVVQGKVSAATQKQALSALIFLYHKVLDIHVDDRIAPVSSIKRLL